MKASELIKQLQKSVEQVGDCPIIVFNADTGNTNWNVIQCIPDTTDAYGTDSTPTGYIEISVCDRGYDMKNRITVRHEMLTDLTNWLISNGWVIKEPKGEYEVLRACKQGYARPLLIYDRDKGCGYSVDERDEKIYRKWQSDRIKRGLLAKMASTQE